MLPAISSTYTPTSEALEAAQESVLTIAEVESTNGHTRAWKKSTRVKLEEIRQTRKRIRRAREEIRRVQEELDKEEREIVERIKKHDLILEKLKD